jgi:hypothetical protein
MWQVELGGSWEKYDAPVGKGLAEAKARGAKDYRFELKGQPMMVDFRTLTQTNLKTGKSRPVREAPSKAPKPTPSAGPAKYPKLTKPTGDAVYEAADDLDALTGKAAMHGVETADSPHHGLKRAEVLAAQGDIHVHPKPSTPPIYVHHTPSAPPAAPVPAVPATPAKTEAKKPETKKRSGPGFFAGMAFGTVAAAGAGVGVGLATGAITTDGIGDVAADVGDALAGVAEDVGDAIEDAALDVADFVTG